MSRRSFRRRSDVRPAIAAAVLLVLTACAGGNGATPEAASSPKQISAAPGGPEPKTTSAPIAPINDDPAQLLGQVPGRIDSLLGSPVRVRKEGGTEIRQYRLTESCQLDAFMYTQDGSARAVHIAVRNGAEPLEGDEARQCVRQLIQRARTG